MQFQDSVTLTAPREKVWAFLLDPHAFAECVPGLDDVEIYEDGRAFGGVAQFRFGSNQLRFPIRVEWIEQRMLEGGRVRALARLADYRVEAEGSLELRAVESETEVIWEVGFIPPADFQENPLLFQMGQNAVVQIIKRFFKCLRAQLETS